MVFSLTIENSQPPQSSVSMRRFFGFAIFFSIGKPRLQWSLASTRLNVIYTLNFPNSKSSTFTNFISNPFLFTLAVSSCASFVKLKPTI